MAKYDKADIERRMHGAVEALKHDLAGLRTGRANTALNTFFFIGAFTLQYMVGLVIDLFPAATTTGGYPVLAYQLAFGAMLTAQIASWTWLLIPPRAPSEAL